MERQRLEQSGRSFALGNRPNSELVRFVNQDLSQDLCNREKLRNTAISDSLDVGVPSLTFGIFDRSCITRTGALSSFVLRKNAAQNT
jgi:hypothetical protein